MRTNSHAYAKDLGLAGVVLLSRLPFLSPGAGNDDDGWFLVNAAREIAATGRYTTSRFPGYPVQEWLASGVARLGPRRGVLFARVRPLRLAFPELRRSTRRREHAGRFRHGIPPPGSPSVPPGARRGPGHGAPLGRARNAARRRGVRGGRLSPP